MSRPGFSLFLRAMALILLVQTARADYINVTVSGKADPWLAGMPDGSTASGIPFIAPAPDVAPANSPALVVGLPLTGGMVLTFDVTGKVGYGPGFFRQSGPDGMLYLGLFHTTHLAGAENGIANTTTRLNALMGVFLDDSQPDLSPAPGALDFSPGGNVPGGTNYSSLSPALKQPFFIGDGLDSLANPQQIIAPEGATRLFLGVADGWDWTDNTGSYAVRVNYSPVLSPASGELVPEPGTLALLLSGTAGLGLFAWRRRRSSTGQDRPRHCSSAELGRR